MVEKEGFCCFCGFQLGGVGKKQGPPLHRIFYGLGGRPLVGATGREDQKPIGPIGGLDVRLSSWTSGQNKPSKPLNH